MTEAEKLEQRLIQIDYDLDLIRHCKSIQNAIQALEYDSKRIGRELKACQKDLNNAD